MSELGVLFFLGLVLWELSQKDKKISALNASLQAEATGQWRDFSPYPVQSSTAEAIDAHRASLAADFDALIIMSRQSMNGRA